MNNKPLVTVVIPAYNRGAVLEKSVRSVLEQSYWELEVILVDDGSTDHTRQVAAQITDPRFFYVYQENAGACAARNRGAAMARGEYIAFHDSDDIWHLDKLEKQMEKLCEVEADVVVCKMNRFGQDGTITQYPKRIRDGFLTMQDDLFGIGTQTILVRKEVLSRVPFRTELPRYQDLEWFIHAMDMYRIYCMNEAMVDYYIGEDSISRKAGRMYDAFLLFREYYPHLPKEAPLLCLHIMRDLLAGWQETRKEDPVRSLRFLKLAKAYFPGMRACIRYLTGNHPIC